MAYHTSKPASLQLTPQPLYGGLPLPASISAALNHAGTGKQAARDPPTPAAQNPLKSFEPVSPELFPLPCLARGKHKKGSGQSLLSFLLPADQPWCFPVCP